MIQTIIILKLFALIQWSWLEVAGFVLAVATMNLIVKKVVENYGK